MNDTTTKQPPVTKVPARLEPFGGIGWTVYEFSDAHQAAAWVSRHRDAAMPCWKRWDVIGGALTLVR